MPASARREAEPGPAAGPVCFEEGDFHALSAACASDPQFNDRRLVARRKLAALGAEGVRRAKRLGATLEARTSLHAPHAFNRMRVSRLWVYLCRAKADKKRLGRVLGAELARDLDAAYRNAYLCLALEAEALEVSLRVHPDAWYDGQNLAKRVAREGPAELLGILNELGGFTLRLDDWKGEWVCGRLEPERLEEFLGYWRPGEHGLAVVQRLPAPAGARGAAVEPGTPEGMLAELERLVPLYRYAAWSAESDYLFG